jgi:hypothetical protein
MTLPPQVDRMLWAKATARFTGSVTLHFKEGTILAFETTEKTRVETHREPMPVKAGISRDLLHH